MAQNTNQEDYIRGTGLFKPRVYRLVRKEEKNSSQNGLTPSTEHIVELVPEEELYSTNGSSLLEPHCMHCSHFYYGRANPSIINEQCLQTQEDSRLRAKLFQKSLCFFMPLLVIMIYGYFKLRH
ncbi:hypothetical protein NPIL_167901 [Nephila pilipes]|uniref:Uncharacterized protein n=1 Tax=Nephila pilipes TaxID=299642 RepID=A0A8X6PRN8_NEPPI|nr:hypothetical protein NPIL_167901 [Nephila pilipes]